MRYKTILDVGDGFGDRTPACREYTLPREDQNSRICATIPRQTKLDLFFKFILHDILKLKFRYLPQPQKIDTLLVIGRGKHRYVEELRHNDPDHNPASSELLEHKGLERSIAKKRAPGSTKMVLSWSNTKQL